MMRLHTGGARRRGFTLIEVLLVVSIIGIMTALGVSSTVGALRRMQSRDAAYKARDTIITARNMARKTLCNVTVTNTGTSITATPDASAACSTTTIPAKVTQTGNKITLGALSGALVFTPSGSVLSGSTVSLPISSAIGTYTITVLPGIGQVRISP